MGNVSNFDHNIKFIIIFTYVWVTVKGLNISTTPSFEIRSFVIWIGFPHVWIQGVHCTSTDMTCENFGVTNSFYIIETFDHIYSKYLCGMTSLTQIKTNEIKWFLYKKHLQSPYQYFYTLYIHDLYIVRGTYGVFSPFFPPFFWFRLLRLKYVKD